MHQYNSLAHVTVSFGNCEEMKRETIEGEEDDTTVGVGEATVGEAVGLGEEIAGSGEAIAGLGEAIAGLGEATTGLGGTIIFEDSSCLFNALCTNIFIISTFL